MVGTTAHRAGRRHLSWALATAATLAILIGTLMVGYALTHHHPSTIDRRIMPAVYQLPTSRPVLYA